MLKSAVLDYKNKTLLKSVIIPPLLSKNELV